VEIAGKPMRVKVAQMRLTAAKLPVIKDFDDFAFEGTPINEELVRALHAGSFLPGRRNIVLISGT
jgi:hypothetical protein